MNIDITNIPRKIIMWLLCLDFGLSSAFAVAQSETENAAQQYQQAMQSWANVLSTYVDEKGRINFYGIKENPKELRSVVDAIEIYGPDSHPEDFKDADVLMAYHINTYNALAMQGVIDRDIPKGFTSTIKRASFFLLRKVTIAGKKTNLYHYENKVIRPLDEPRSHFALNCMVKDCPRLPQKPFTAENLDAELDVAAKEFFSKPVHFNIDHDKKRINVSSILKFYTEDFVESGKKKDLPNYINQYLSEKLPEDYKVSYIKYDWRINQQP
ncbi:DUF547 domain-containing protein [Sessilibacter corallicola]|uniref:DUF547 domain-containing protein n=2 Tax=Sessilibacter corallicola TaxID=2904075 RepID=A0ABQ0A8N6_9GAMM